MEFIRSIASIVSSAVLSPLSGHHALIGLIPLSILIGIGMLWIFGQTSDQDAIRKAKGKLQAHLYEMRLFTDEPVLIWRAQRGLLAANARYIGLMLIPALVASIPMVLILTQLESFYGHSPLASGREAIVTVQMKGALPDTAPALQAPEGIAVESPGIRIAGARQISWRIRALHPVKGVLQFVFPDRTIEKDILAAQGPRYFSARRVSSPFDLIWYPAEARLSPGDVDWIEVRYPEATVHTLGLDVHWLIWLLALSMMSALLLKRRFGVSF
jgi:hypothetical protein